ncbi:hypothetical protein PIB30_028191 [Stylosanthes scabra]|uniref:Uncharacterized protein n=1 Tax=Stylosanthes scabra TaxID=79078 RepID=A0ABU6RB75_9FABA|nr:hypothetical protein [Stylosanthes scabra]
MEEKRERTAPAVLTSTAAAVAGAIRERKRERNRDGERERDRRKESERHERSSIAIELKSSSPSVEAAAVLTTIAAVDGRTTHGGDGCYQARRERERTCSVTVVYMSSIAGEPFFRQQFSSPPVFLETTGATGRFPPFLRCCLFSSSRCQSSFTVLTAEDNRCCHPKPTAGVVTVGSTAISTLYVARSCYFPLLLVFRPLPLLHVVAGAAATLFVVSLKF